MKQVISIHIGEAGINAGSSCWQLFCLEHRINQDGTIPNHTFKDNHNIHSFFSEDSKERVIPRAIYIDLEPTVINQLRIGLRNYSELLDPQNLISGKDNASNNFGRGKNTQGKKILDICQQRIRKQAEKCEDLQGFIVSSSTGGGTGSGLGSLIAEHISSSYEKKVKLGLNIFPSPQLSTSCVQPYNSIFATHGLLDQGDISLVLDNDAVYNICKRNLNIESPSFVQMNRIIAHAGSTITEPLRFNRYSNSSSLKEILDDHIPYPRFQFLISSFAPIIRADDVFFGDTLPRQLTDHLFESANMTAKCDHRNGKFMAITINYKGQIIPKDVSAAIAMLKTRRNIKFVDWCPTGFKVGINYQTPVIAPGNDWTRIQSSSAMIGNFSGVKSVFARLTRKFDLMYSKKAFLHWYISEGMEEGDFIEAREDVAALQKDYKEVEVEQEYQYTQVE